MISKKYPLAGHFMTLLAVNPSAAMEFVESIPGGCESPDDCVGCKHHEQSDEKDGYCYMFREFQLGCRLNEP